MTTSTPHANRSTDAEHPPDQKKEGLDLSPSKVLASALAATSAAFAASYLGTMGTWIGAAVGSVVATVSTALYHHSLTRTSAKLKTVVPLPAKVSRRLGREPIVRPDNAGGNDAAAPDAAAPDPAAPDAAAPAAANPSGEPERPGVLEWLRSVRWGQLVAVASVVFAVSIGAIVTYELVINKPLSAQVRGTDTKGTSFAPRQRSTTPGTEPAPSRTAAPGVEPSADASPDVEPSNPVESVQPEPSAG